MARKVFKQQCDQADALIARLAPDLAQNHQLIDGVSFYAVAYGDGDDCVDLVSAVALLRFLVEEHYAVFDEEINAQVIVGLDLPADATFDRVVAEAEKLLAKPDSL